MTEYNQEEFSKAFEVIKASMIKDGPSEPGSIAHSWHCNIAMMCYDAIRDHKPFNVHDKDHNDVLRVGNDAASRFMKICFDVETKG